MSTPTVFGAAFRPVRALRGLAVFAGVGTGLSVLGLTTGLGLPCPWRAWTGTLCPFCGGTHLGMALLQGDLAGAWAANPFVFVGLVLLSGLGVLWAVEALGGPAVRPPGRLRLRPDHWLLVIGGLAVAFALWRNLT